MSNEQLLKPLTDLREFAAACARVIVAHGDVDSLEAECKRLGIKDGVGVRAQEALKLLLAVLDAGDALANAAPGMDIDRLVDSWLSAKAALEEKVGGA